MDTSTNFTPVNATVGRAAWARESSRLSRKIFKMASSTAFTSIILSSMTSRPIIQYIWIFLEGEDEGRRLGRWQGKDEGFSVMDESISV